MTAPPCRECGKPGATLSERAVYFCGRRCADRFFHTWAVRALATIAKLRTPSRPRAIAREAMRAERYWP